MYDESIAAYMKPGRRHHARAWRFRENSTFISPCAGRCVTAKTPISRRLSTSSRSIAGPTWRPRSCCTARSSPTTTCSTWTAPCAWFARSPRPAACIVKHNNPCGAAIAADARPPRSSRPTRATRSSAFGGIVALNRPVDSAVRPNGCASPAGSSRRSSPPASTTTPSIWLGPSQPGETASGCSTSARAIGPAVRARPASICAALKVGCSCRAGIRSSPTRPPARSRPLAHRPRPNAETSISPGGSAQCQIQRDRAGQGRSARRRGRRPDEQARLGAYRH